MAKVLFVCLANICRSPAAEGILRHMVSNDSQLKEIHIASCGIGDWSIGQLPDERIREAIKNRGIVLTSRAQLFHPSFLESYDYILAVDHEVLNDLHRHATTAEHRSKIHLITSFSTTYKDQEIPDPYYGGEEAFELVLDMLEDSCEGLLHHLRTR